MSRGFGARAGSDMSMGHIVPHGVLAGVTLAGGGVGRWGEVMIQESESRPILAFYGTFVRKSGFALSAAGVNGEFRARKLSIG